ncbi:hypothetical protein BN14_09256 [Rhizoctonia solani AG-1 IB]|uniref:Pyranose 2-oxidase n=1 Tax=Thanatephorus cucumeris (strain AG1-IB / isolate 7/3/14) TaxID=1108050 RepID=M5C6W0_THACB|nr:hypothetical protein BN14_09256 [Rhizoctonia solani AG-1 IB]
MDNLDPGYDVFIAGSGPLGATYARQVLENHESARVLMVEVGAQEGPIVGMNMKNAVKYQRDFDAFTHIIRGAMQPMSIPPADGFLSALQGDVWSQTKGRSSVGSPFNPDQDHTQALGYGAVTRSVGGMATHWTCCCPEPHDDELVQSPIERSKMRKLLQRGKELLNVRTDQFDTSVRHQLVKKALADAYQHRGISVTSLPLAAERSKDNDTLVEWSGMNTVLGNYIDAKDAHGRNRFKLLTECLVIKFEANPDAPNIIKSALIRDLPHLSLKYWIVVLRKTLLDKLKGENTNLDPSDEVPIPLNDLEPQFHRDSFSYGDVGPQVDQRVVLDIRYFCMLEVQESNRISFATEDHLGRPNTDIYGMPQPTFHFKTTAKDDQLAHVMMKEMCEAASVLGSYLPTAPPQFMASNDSYIHQRGPNCIPDSTVSNPTLTAVAYALQGADDLLHVLRGA